MKTENYARLEELIQKLMELHNDIYDYDYDRETLWYISEAIDNLKSI